MSTSIRLICGYLLICCAVAVYDKRAALLMTHYSSLAYDPEQVETGIGENIR